MHPRLDPITLRRSSVTQHIHTSCITDLTQSVISYTTHPHIMYCRLDPVTLPSYRSSVTQHIHASCIRDFLLSVCVYMQSGMSTDFRLTPNGNLALFHATPWGLGTRLAETRGRSRIYIEGVYDYTSVNLAVDQATLTIKLLNGLESVGDYSLWPFVSSTSISTNRP